MESWDVGLNREIPRNPIFQLSLAQTDLYGRASLDFFQVLVSYFEFDSDKSR